MSEITDRVKEQLEQFNSTIDQLVTASRGLYVKVREESNKQFKELVSAGEATDAETLLKEIRTGVTSPFEDYKGSLEQIKHASRGLIVKARESGEKVFNELVELGQSKKEAAASTTEAQ
jgi:polyhydroxyalkanoate synthesis regulator phasin